MRFLAPAFVSAFALGAFAFACSSSDDEGPATTCDGGACADTGVVDTGAPEELVDAGPTEFSGGGGDGGTRLGDYDAGAPVTGSDAGTLCLANSQIEMEDNSVLQSPQGNVTTQGTFCGSVSSFADIDFLAFTLPQNAENLFIHILASAGGLQVLVTADGVAFPYPSSPPEFVFAPGKPYVIRLSAPQTQKPIDYRVEITSR